MPYKEMSTAAKEKNNKPKKPETIDAFDMQKKKTKSALKTNE